MEFLKRLFKGREKEEERFEEATATSLNEKRKEDPQEEVKVVTIPEWVDQSITKEEEELVATIAAACLANSLPSKKYRVKSIQKIDEDWLVAGLAAISGVSQGNSNERYRIKSIHRVK